MMEAMDETNKVLREILETLKEMERLLRDIQSNTDVNS